MPNLPVGELAGIQITRLSTNVCLTNYRIAPCAENLLCLAKPPDKPSTPAEAGTDAWAVAHGYLSITPLRVFPDLIDGVPWPALAQAAAHGAALRPALNSVTVG